MKNWNLLDWLVAIWTILMIVLFIAFIIWAFSLPWHNNNNSSNDTYTPSVHLMPNGKGGFSTYVY